MMDATNENARLESAILQTGGGNNGKKRNAFQIPHCDSTTPEMRRQYNTQQNFTPYTIRDVFKEAKERVSVLEAARRLGLGEPDRSGKILCPFHDDHHPSLSLDTTRNRWKCFVCNIGGDATDLAAQCLNIGKREAAEWLYTPKAAPVSSGPARTDEYFFHYPDGRESKKVITRRDGKKFPRALLGRRTVADRP